MKLGTRGNVGEAKVLAALAQMGCDVLIPFGGGHPYDLVVAAREQKFLRVQCKTGWERGGCVIFNACSTDHGSGQRSYAGLADIFGVYFPPEDAIYLVPVASLSGPEGRLRLRPTRNNQRKRVRQAADYLLSRWSPESLADVA